MQHSRFLIAVVAVALINSASGCQMFKNDSRMVLTPEEERLYSSDDRAKPWVKDLSATGDPDGDGEDYLVDADVTDKLKQKARTAVGKGPNQEAALKLSAKADVIFEKAAEAKNSGAPASQFADAFSQAAKLYLTAAERWPKSSLEQDAMFRAGECFFFSDQYSKANDAYESLVAKYRGTRYMDVVQGRRFTIAMFWLDLNRESSDNFLTYRMFAKMRPKRDAGGEALRILDKIRLDDPTGKLADDATLALANGYFERKRYLDASDTYEDLRRTFPNSEHQFDAHLFELRSRLQSYRGSDYDSKNLMIAEKLLKTMVTQFPQRAEEHREFLSKEAARVRMMQAQRELSLAEYYDGRGENRAAQMHYEELARNYPDTPIGDSARQRIGEISDSPPEPPQRMAWLVNLFPEAEETKPLLAPTAKESLIR